MAAFCVIGYFLAMFDGFGVINFIDKPNEKLESVGRMPYTGQFKKEFKVEPTSRDEDPQAGSETQQSLANDVADHE